MRGAPWIKCLSTSRTQGPDHGRRLGSGTAAQWEARRTVLAGLASELDESFIPRPVAAPQRQAPSQTGQSVGRCTPSR